MELLETLRQSATSPMPRLCHDIEGIGGTLKARAQDFEVEEVPAYAPSGEGEHLYLWLEKTDMPAFALTRWLSESLGVRADDIGCAGLKDARAVTRQYVSVPKACEPRLASLEGHPQVRLLHARGHTNKLKTGHLRGNRFRIRLTEVAPDALGRAQQILARLTDLGLPNSYGPQRFGHQGHTAVLGAQALGLGPQSGRRLGKSTLRLGLSALQSTVFNACLRQRMARGLWQQPLLGDVMQVRLSGGPFVVEDPARERARLDAHEVVLTGPMPGPKMRAATGEGLALETAVLESLGLSWQTFAGPNKLMQGTRRAAVVWPEEVSVEAGDEASLVVQFTLPKGAFATSLMNELMGYPATSGEAPPATMARG